MPFDSSGSTDLLQQSTSTLMLWQFCPHFLRNNNQSQAFLVSLNSIMLCLFIAKVKNIVKVMPLSQFNFYFDLHTFHLFESEFHFPSLWIWISCFISLRESVNFICIYSIYLNVNFMFYSIESECEFHVFISMNLNVNFMFYLFAPECECHVPSIWIWNSCFISLNPNVNSMFYLYESECEFQAPSLWIWISCFISFNLNVNFILYLIQPECEFHVLSLWIWMWISCSINLNLNVNFMFYLFESKSEFHVPSI